MTTAAILLVSGVLIGAGISIIWRDVRAKHRRAVVNKLDARRSPPPDPAGEITSSYHPQPAAARLRERSTPEPSRRGANLPVEHEWSNLQPALAAGVDKINAVLAPVRLSVAATGEPSWSYKNRGYGAYRRLLLGGESVAWLRLELSPDRRLHASVKAHKEDRAEINAAADAPAEGLNAARASDLL